MGLGLEGGGWVGGGVRAVAWNPWKDVVGLGLGSGEVRAVRLGWRRAWRAGGFGEAVGAAVWSPDGLLLCVAYQRSRLRLLRLLDGTQAHSAALLHAQPSAAAWTTLSKSGSVLALASEEGFLTLYLQGLYPYLDVELPMGLEPSSVCLGPSLSGVGVGGSLAGRAMACVAVWGGAVSPTEREWGQSAAYAQVDQALERAEGVVEAMAEAWADGLADMDAKLSKLARDKFLEEGGCLGEEIQSLLILGSLGDSAIRLLMETEGLDKLSGGIEKAVERTVALVREDLAGSLADLTRSLCALRAGLGDGASEGSRLMDQVVQLSGDLAAKALELEALVVRSGHDSLLFLRVLHGNHLQFQGKEPPPGFHSILDSRKTLDRLLDYVDRNLMAEVETDSKRLQLDKVAQYLQPGPMTHPLAQAKRSPAHETSALDVSSMTLATPQRQPRKALHFDSASFRHDNPARSSEAVSDRRSLVDLVQELRVRLGQTLQSLLGERSARASPLEPHQLGRTPEPGKVLLQLDAKTAVLSALRRSEEGGLWLHWGPLGAGPSEAVELGLGPGRRAVDAEWTGEGLAVLAVEEGRASVRRWERAEETGAWAEVEADEVEGFGDAAFLHLNAQRGLGALTNGPRTRLLLLNLQPDDPDQTASPNTSRLSHLNQTPSFVA